MKKNYSQKFFKPQATNQHNGKNAQVLKNKQENQPSKRIFSRKPANGCPPSTKKRVQDSVDQIDTTFQQNNISQLLEKSKKLKFISCRSQSSLGSSIISRSSTCLSMAQSFNQKNDLQTSYSRLFADQSIIQESKERKSNNQREIFRRKTMQNTKSSIFCRQKINNQSLNTSIFENNKYSKKLDRAEQQTKLESSQLSQISKSFYKPYTNIMNKNIVNGSKNSSKQSMRKSNSSNSLIKRQNVRCQECEFHKKQLIQLSQQNQRLERILKNKQDDIHQLNRKLQQNERKNRELERKIKQIQKSNFQNKLKVLQEEYALFQQESNRTKDTLTKTLQELKYKNIENCTLKKYQTQCQSLERKVQMLVAERNQLRQRLSSVKVTQKSNYLNYPSSLSKNKIQSSCRLPQADKNRDSYTSRGQIDDQEDCFEDDDFSYNNESIRTHNDVFMKKKSFVKCYDDSSESEIISLSQQSTYQTF